MQKVTQNLTFSEPFTTDHENKQRISFLLFLFYTKTGLIRYC
jgi:hypothetical protein